MLRHFSKSRLNFHALRWLSLTPSSHDRAGMWRGQIQATNNHIKKEANGKIYKLPVDQTQTKSFEQFLQDLNPTQKFDFMQFKSEYFPNGFHSTVTDKLFFQENFNNSTTGTGSSVIDKNTQLTVKQQVYVAKKLGYTSVSIEQSRFKLGLFKVFDLDDIENSSTQALENSKEKVLSATKKISKIEVKQLKTTSGEMTRNPAIVICGHVDHGKTSILDRIRETDVQSGEAGGITQHISAFTFDNVVFLDTPGHAAFSDMRQRGVFNADLAVLVVAADDGVMPQTEQCLEYIKEKNVPFIVAINKVDKVSKTQVESVIESLVMEYEIDAESFGGSVPIISVSAKKNKGIKDDLVAAIKQVTQNEVHLETSAKAAVEGFIVENHQGGKGIGSISATCFLQAGTVKVGQNLKVGDSICRVKGAL